MPALAAEQIPALQDEVRALAQQRNALVLAHNYQLPEVQDVADYVGDSLGLARKAADSDSEVIAFCGVHFMAETASVLCPDRTVLLPSLAAGCSLADSITAGQLRHWRATHPGAIAVMYVNTSAEVKAETDYCCTSSNAVAVVEHVWREHGGDTEILFGPDMWLGAFVERETGLRDDPRRRGRFHIWDGECHVHAGIRESDLEIAHARYPEADLLIHPECASGDWAAEKVEAGELRAEQVRFLSTGGMLKYAETAGPGPVIVATETGMLHPLRKRAPQTEFVEVNSAAVCQYMKAITLPGLRDSLRDLVHEIRVPAEIAERARLPIERMVAIS